MNLTEIYNLAFPGKAPFDGSSINSGDFFYALLIENCIYKSKIIPSDYTFDKPDVLDYLSLALATSNISLDDIWCYFTEFIYDTTFDIDKILYRKFPKDDLFKNVKIPQELASDNVSVDENEKITPAKVFLKLAKYIDFDFLPKYISQLNDDGKTYCSAHLSNLASNIKILKSASSKTFYENMFEQVGSKIGKLEIKDSYAKLISESSESNLSYARLYIDEFYKIFYKGKNPTIQPPMNKPTSNSLVLPKKEDEKEDLPQNFEMTFEKMIALKNLKNVIWGQDESINQIVDTITNACVGFHTKNEPIASILLTGPTGVGKTETAKAIANILFDGKIHTEDMSTYKNDIDISRLIGAAPNYVGYNDKISFCEFLKKNPCSVLLFDEVGRCHKDCQDILFRMLDEGEFTNAKGEKFPLNNTIIICTTNYSATKKPNVNDIFFGDKTSVAEKMTEVDGMEKALVGRFDEVFEYKTLTLDACSEIAKKFINIKINTFEENNQSKNIKIEYDPSLIEKITKNANTKVFGSRDLKKTINKEFITPLCRFIIENDPKDCIIKVSKDGYKIVQNIIEKEIEDDIEDFTNEDVELLKNEALTLNQSSGNKDF